MTNRVLSTTSHSVHGGAYADHPSMLSFTFVVIIINHMDQLMDELNDCRK
jgi:hypothetical protein